ncbi:MAG: 3-isopropylmalate dehydrogenase [Candidatus Marinimicrobia bacterium]|nr:3-isopropylmalate dehydrogenase [Candidatus Neomarinimicrobiota bacterium]
MKTYQLTVLSGDGIGPEVVDVALDVLSVASKQANIQFDVTEKLMGGCAFEKTGHPLPQDTLDACLESDAVLLGAVGGPKWDELPHEKKPEQALLGLRKALGLFSNLRPAKVYDALVDASSLKSEIVRGSDVMVVRELTGGIYFSEPRGMDDSKGWNTLAYEKEEVDRIACVAFELAQKRNGRLTSVHKANVLESSQFWRECVNRIHGDYPDVSLSEMYVDNAAMQLVRDPRQFDVIVTQNLFGDILSDIAAMITGSLGMLPSASMGKKYAMYEPVHGSAPEIAGTNQANPIATIGSIAMMLEYTFNEPESAQRINRAIDQVLKDGYRTKDIASKDSIIVSTSEMRNHIIENLKQDETSIIEMVRTSYEE